MSFLGRLALVSVWWIASGTEFEAAVAELGKRDDTLRQERVKEGETRRITMGVYIRAFPDSANNTEPIAFKKMVLKAKGSCKMATRDLTDGIKDIKLFSARIFEHSTVRFIDDGVQVPDTGEPRVGETMTAFQGRDMIDPTVAYEIGGGDWGEKGETWTGVAVEVGRNGNKCELCKVKAVLHPVVGDKLKTANFVIRLGDRFCPDGAQYIV